ncbi:unnamed protein product [Cuscuta epithymum]|uniref:Uncharacterized protein n=1 Tax=Cuscuta epithymum TaxID=186058 RepID=A0AAV0DI62_9ASTE|nr:unnamed protein product [Cuscuta epithymum]
MKKCSGKELDSWFIFEAGIESKNWFGGSDGHGCVKHIQNNIDGAVGINQAGNSFWSRVHNLFCEKANTIVRTREAVESRFKVMNHQCSLWKRSLQKANATQRSGSNLIDVVF